jgi:hypothetical protein
MVTVMTEALVDRLWQELCDKDDRTSPADHPDMCLITKGELMLFMADAVVGEHERRRHGMEIEESREIDSGAVMGYFARGHFPVHHFAEACNDYTGADPYYDRRHVKADDVRHEWWRTVPVTGEPGVVAYHHAEPRSRGAFAVTVTTVVEDRDRRQTQREIDQHNKGIASGFAEGLNWALLKLDHLNHRDASDELLRFYREENKKEKPHG